MSFQRNYSRYYDIFYHDKDYEKECSFLENAFKKHSVFPIKRVLDMGCGTGGYLIPLSERGYEITGIDASTGMLEQAKRKTKERGIRVRLEQMTLQELDLGEKFDSVICMFNTIDYLTEKKEMIKTLMNVRKHLKDGGLFIFDFRQTAPAMESYSPQRVRYFRNGKIEIIRISNSRVDREANLFFTDYDCIVIQKKSVIERFHETHKLKVYSPQEINHLLRKNKLEILEMCPFPNLEEKVKKNDWNIAVITRKKR